MSQFFFGRGGGGWAVATNGREKKRHSPARIEGDVGFFVTSRGGIRGGKDGSLSFTTPAMPKQHKEKKKNKNDRTIASVLKLLGKDLKLCTGANMPYCVEHARIHMEAAEKKKPGHAGIAFTTGDADDHEADVYFAPETEAMGFAIVGALAARRVPTRWPGDANEPVRILIPEICPRAHWSNKKEEEEDEDEMEHRQDRNAC